MSLSDSDDDCYGNAAKRLQSLKSTYVPEKFDDVDLEFTKSELLSKHVASSLTLLDDSNASVNNVDDEELSLETIIANNTKAKRGRKRKIVANTSEPVYERVTRSGRKMKRQADECSITNENPSGSLNVDTLTTRGRKKSSGRLLSQFDSSRRGRGNNSSPREARGRRRRGRGARNISTQENIYPTYSIGDFGLYPDLCQNQELFSSKPNEIEINKDDSIENDNEELSVKVYWQSSKVFRFKIRRYQKLTQIFKYFSEKENIDDCKLLLMYKDRIIKAEDTPDIINYNIAEFIDGGVVNSDITNLVKHNLNTEPINGLKIKFQCQSLKKPFELIVKQEEKLVMAMNLCAEHLEQSLDKLKFYFDGDLISSKSTPKELGLENGDCIDIKIIS